MTILFACRSAEVAFPDGSDNTMFTKYDVKGRRSFAVFSGKFSIGSYNVNWTSGALKNSTPFFGKENVSVSEQDFTIAVRGAGDLSWNGTCRSKAEIEKETKKQSKKVTETTTFVHSNILTCNFKSSDNNTFEIKMIQENAMAIKKKGTVKGKNLNFEIQNTTGIKDGWNMFSTTGYYITESGKTIAIVDILNDGKVYISKGLKKDRIQALVATSAALLAYKDPAN